MAKVAPQTKSTSSVNPGSAAPNGSGGAKAPAASDPRAGLSNEQLLGLYRTT